MSLWVRIVPLSLRVRIVPVSQDLHRHPCFVDMQVPPQVKELHYEVELGVVIGKEGRDIPEEFAMSYVGGYALALDMTARDLQSAAKKKGHPWSVAKGFDTFCPVSKFIEKERISLDATTLWLKVDGAVRQNGSTKDLIFSVPFLISYISRIFRLEPGDLILTGTPEGVGPVKPGQTVSAGIEGVTEMSFSVKARD